MCIRDRMALTLTPALCAALLQNSPGHEMVPTKGVLGWFNRSFSKTTQRYKSGVGGVLKRTGRYLVLYAGLLGVVGWLFVHLPSSVLPDEDQGYFCLLYTSDAADDLTRVDLGGRRIIKK